MDKRFKDLIDPLPAKYEALITCYPLKVSSLPRDLPKSGVYVLYEGGKALYVGRTNNMRGRLQHHSRQSAPDAPLAFRIARDETNQPKASYQPHGSRKALLKDEGFRRAYDKAKARIRGMDIRYIKEENQALQALLEIYAAIVLDTDYNSFGTS